MLPRQRVVSLHCFRKLLQPCWSHPTRERVRRQSQHSPASAMAIPGGQLEVLQKYTACDISDALLKLKVPGAGFLSDLPLYSRAEGSAGGGLTIAPASTVLFAPKGTDLDCPRPNIPAGAHWADLTEADTVVVVRQPDGQ